ncbi:MAG: GTPase/DUF3482 domain-containing protein [Pseudomonadota bacterium]
MKNGLDIAVIGHTNTGKTSLMRTLTRERDFGEVSARPATTRHVEMAALAVGGQAAVRLYDTPGFEDSSGLLRHVDALRQSRGEDWLEALRAFARQPGLQAGFTQEAKALAQLLAADVVLYVIDAREPVHGKYRDELELLGRTARPVVAVLNFIAAGDADEDAWREALARVNMHAVVAFDTVVFDEAGELALYGKIAALAERHAPLLDELRAGLTARRAALRRAGAVMVAEMLVDIAAARRIYAADDDQARALTARALKSATRARERETVAALLDLYRFKENDYLPDTLAISEGAWREDAFDPKVLERFGLDAGKAMATGAAAGLALDLMVGGLSLGAAALGGAAVGFVIDTLRRHGGRLKETLTGLAALRVDTPTLRLLAQREAALLAALLKRGHGAQEAMRAAAIDDEGLWQALAPHLKAARRAPGWSALSDGVARPPASAARRALIERLADVLEKALATG